MFTVLMDNGPWFRLDFFLGGITGVLSAFLVNITLVRFVI